MAVSHWHLFEEENDPAQLNNARRVIEEGAEIADKHVLYYQLQFELLKVKDDLFQKKYK